jgi:preprotein translocase subunit SecD
MWCKQVVLLFVACSACIPLVEPAVGDDKPAKKKPTIDIRWAEDKAVKGVTDDKGVDLSCSDKKAYLHTKPILTGADLAGGTAQQVGGGGIVGAGPAAHLVTIHVKKDAAKVLAKSSGENKNKPLVVLVDGKIVAAVVVMTDLTDSVPILASFTPESLKAFTDLLGEK